MKNFTNYKSNGGQMLLLAVIVLGVVLMGLLSLVGGSQLYFQNTQHAKLSEQANALAEAGLDKAVASINKSGGSYNGEQETVLGNGSYSVTVMDKDLSTKLLQATGYIPNKLNPRIKRTINIQVSKGTGVSFVYAMQMGNGGITMGNNSTINGTIYSNGSISGGNSVTITGDAYVAGGIQPTSDQQNDCSGANCIDYIFGKNWSGENRLYIAQSFKPSSTLAIRKVSLKLKKVGSPANLTVRIMGNNNGKPDKNNVLASGSIPSSLVTGAYSFIDVSFNSNPTLNANTTYWIMIGAASLDNSNYWMISEDLAQSYQSGSTSWSPDWQAGNPIWNNISGDFGFKTWMGGVITSISLGNGSKVNGNVHANTISGITISKDAYYQTITNSVVKGVSYPNSADPAPTTFPISDANITAWKTSAQDAGVTTGNISGCPATLNSGKIVGNVTINNGCTVIVTTPVWVTGNLTFGNSTTFKMNPSLGVSSGVIIVDGTTVFGNFGQLLGTGQSGSFLTLLSTYNSSVLGGNAISIGNGSVTGILYAPDGKINLSNSANFKEAVGWQLVLGTGAVLNYDSGLVSTFFTTGPSGTYSSIKGTYQVK